MKLNIRGKIFFGVFYTITFMVIEYLLANIIFQHDRPVVYVPCIIILFGIVMIVCSVHDYKAKHRNDIKRMIEAAYEQ